MLIAGRATRALDSSVVLSVMSIWDRTLSRLLSTWFPELVSGGVSVKGSEISKPGCTGELERKQYNIRYILQKFKMHCAKAPMVLNLIDYNSNRKCKA